MLVTKIEVLDSIKDLADQSRKKAKQKYQDEQQKFCLQMMMMSYYKMKSLLTEEGFKKVSETDFKRENDELFNENLSQSIWLITEEAWNRALGPMIIKISEAYGLEIGKHLDSPIYKIDSEKKSDLDFYV